METTEKTIWINLPEDEKLTILSNIAEEKGIKENAIASAVKLINNLFKLGCKHIIHPIHPSNIIVPIVILQ